MLATCPFVLADLSAFGRFLEPRGLPRPRPPPRPPPLPPLRPPSSPPLRPPSSPPPRPSSITSSLTSTLFGIGDNIGLSKSTKQKKIYDCSVKIRNGDFLDSDSYCDPPPPVFKKYFG